MIRVLAFLVVTGLIALGAVWLADRPGQIAITWLGYRADTSVTVAVLAMLAIAIVSIAVWSIVRFLFRSPKLFSLAMRDRRRRAGYDAISHGLIAIGAGDPQAALRFAANAEKKLPGEPLTLLLRAQTAQLHGDRTSAEQAFRAMAERDDTRLLGLRGLFIEAQRRNDPVAARLLAEQAFKDEPAAAWANQAVFDLRCRAADWDGALALLETNRRTGTLERDAFRRQRAVLLTARAIAAVDDNRDTARTLAVDATRLVPELVPAAALAGRLLAESGERRKAGKILEAAWKANPHPDLADTFAHLRLADSARERLARVQALARLAPGHAESALAVARAAMDAREFAAAREALAPFVSEPTRRVAVLMAELEQLEGDDGRTREWMNRAVNAARDPAWTADGYVSDRWLPVSPVTGKLDAFQWKVPLAELGRPAPVIIEAPPEPEPQSGPMAPPQLSDPVSHDPASPLPGNAEPESGTPAAPAQPPIPRAAPIIPLTPPPDDPGPEPEPVSDVEIADAPPSPGWQRIRQLFR